MLNVNAISFFPRKFVPKDTPPVRLCRRGNKPSLMNLLLRHPECRAEYCVNCSNCRAQHEHLASLTPDSPNVEFAKITYNVKKTAYLRYPCEPGIPITKLYKKTKYFVIPFGYLDQTSSHYDKHLKHFIPRPDAYYDADIIAAVSSVKIYRCFKEISGLCSRLSSCVVCNF